MWNLSQTLVFTMYIAHTDTAFWHHFHPWITKNMDLETVSHSGSPNHWKITKRCPKCIPGDSQNDSKIDKNPHPDLQVPVGWSLGSLDHQNGVPGTQNGVSRSPKWQVWVSKVTHFSNQPVSNCLLTRGRRQGAKPLNIQLHIVYIYIYVNW